MPAVQQISHLAALLFVLASSIALVSSARVGSLQTSSAITATSEELEAQVPHRRRLTQADVVGNLFSFFFPPIQTDNATGTTYINRTIDIGGFSFTNVLYLTAKDNNGSFKTDLGYRNNFTINNPLFGDTYKATDSYHVGTNTSTNGNLGLDVFGGRYNDAEWLSQNKTNYKGAFFDFWNAGTSGPIWNGSDNLTLGNTTYSYPFTHGPYTTDNGPVPTPSPLPFGKKK